MPLNYTTLASASTTFKWHTNINGLNDDNSFSSISAIGIADGTIKDIKSYSYTTNTAPDYYTYIAYSASGNVPDHIQIRVNDYRNTCVLSATHLGSNPNIPTFQSINAIDVINNQLYILDSGIVYKAGLNINSTIDTSYLTSLQKIGSSVAGDINDKNNFNNPKDIRACNQLLYVCDSFNSCVKVYNTALSWVNTLYVNQLSAYSTERIEINPVSNNAYILGKTFAPVAPILTGVSAVSLNATTTNYTVSWVHDGLRLLQPTSINSLSAFNLFGLPTDGQTFVMLTSAALVSATPSTYNGSIYGQTQSVTYTAASGITYTNFAIQAKGNNKFNSDLSNSVPTPYSYYFNSPYKVFEINSSNQLVNSFVLPSNTKHISPAGNIQSTTNINKVCIDPTGVFLYFITDSYIYKYLTNGTALVRVEDPSKSSLGGYETLRTGFIDNRLNFFVATDKRVFKYLDLPNTLNLYNASVVDTLFTSLSGITINSEEFVQDWVYNKSILKLLQNHEIFYKSIRGKYNINLDYNNNLITDGNNGFTVTGLRSTDIGSSLNIDQNNFVHSNEFVTSAVVNRVLTNLYNLQLQILKLVSPIITKQLPGYTSTTGNVLTNENGIPIVTGNGDSIQIV